MIYKFFLLHNFGVQIICFKLEIKFETKTFKESVEIIVQYHFFLRNYLTYGLCSDLILYPLEYFQRFYVNEPKTTLFSQRHCFKLVVIQVLWFGRIRSHAQRIVITL